MVLENIRIYNNEGNLLNYRIENGTMYVAINFPKVSINLIENQRIYVLEDVSDFATGDIVTASPKYNSSTTLVLDDAEFSLFTVDKNLFEINTTTERDDVMGDFIDDSSNSFVGGYRQVLVPVAKPMVLDVLFKADCEGNYQTEMLLAEGNKSIVFSLYGEAEGSDVRLINLLKRFGEDLTQNEEIIFREADINDDLQSHKLLNEKRKALLNNVAELPYLSSIRGLEFIIKYFCYDDILTIKEYYLDTTDNKLVSFEHDDLTSDRTNLLKQASFGLCYALNKVTEEVDECGNPITEDTFTMPVEEIIVKLFALKRYIERRNIGGVSKILDVVGERVSFRSYKQSFWRNQSIVWCVQKQECPELELLDFTKCIIDLRTYYQSFVCHLDQDEDLSDLQIATINNCFIGYFANFYQDEPTVFDEPNIEVGAVAVIRNTSFDLSWEEADISWDIPDPPITINWINIGGVLYHTTKITVRGGDTQTHLQEYILDNSVTDSVDVILPFVGSYDVTVELLGYNNNTAKRTYYGYLEVEMKEVEFMTFHKYQDRNLQVWETNHIPFQDIHIDWNSIIYDNGQFTIDEGEINFRTYDLINYLFFKTDDGFGELNWLEYDDNSWDNLQYFSWRDTVYRTKMLANAIVGSFLPGDTVQLDDINLDVPATINISNYVGLANHWSTLTDEYTFAPKTDFLGKRFIEVISNTGGTPANFFIASTGTTDIEAAINLSNWNDWNDVTFGNWNDLLVTWNASDELYKSDATDEEFTIDNTRFFRNEFDCPRYVPIFFSIDDSDIAGKSKATYTFYDELGAQIDQIEGLYIVKRFTETGFYSVECEVEDTNGNKKNLLKNKIINILDHDDYRELSSRGELLLS